MKTTMKGITLAATVAMLFVFSPFALAEKPPEPVFDGSYTLLNMDSDRSNCAVGLMKEFDDLDGMGKMFALERIDKVCSRPLNEWSASKQLDAQVQFAKAQAKANRPHWSEIVLGFAGIAVNGYAGVNHDNKRFSYMKRQSDNEFRTTREIVRGTRIQGRDMIIGGGNSAFNPVTFPPPEPESSSSSDSESEE